MRHAPNLAWVVGIVGAFALHAGGALFAYANLQTSDHDADDGASAIEVSLAFEAPKVEETDLPPGPLSDASNAAALATEQTTQADRKPAPVEQPTETEDPDRVVVQEEVKEQAEKMPKTSQTQARESAESIAAEATAPPAITTAAEASKAASPTVGAGRSAIRVRTTWQKSLVAHLDRNKRYPESGQRRNAELTVAFTLDRVGHVLSARVIKSSGSIDFDDAALRMLSRADPVPAPPPLVAEEGLNFTVPVIFSAKR